MRSRILFSAGSAVLWLAAGVVQGYSPGRAPASTAGLDIVLTIEHTESSLPGGFPTMGAVTQSYAADGTYTYAGFGGPNHLTGTGTYTYTKTGRDSASEDAVQYSDFFTLPYHLEYTFVTADSGRWKQYFAGGLIVFAGSFATARTGSRAAWAPESLSGARFLLFVGRGHSAGESVKISHTVDTYQARRGAARELETGTYLARKMSARSLVEARTSASGVLVVTTFTFTRRRGGYWIAASAGDDTRGEGRFLYLR